MARDIPYCPLMSAGSDIDKVCTLESCAWYLPSVRKCSMYMLAYNALVETNARQKQLTKTTDKVLYENNCLYKTGS